MSRHFLRPFIRKYGLYWSRSACISAGRGVSLAIWTAAAQSAGVALAKLLPVLGRSFHFGWHLRSTFSDRRLLFWYCLSAMGHKTASISHSPLLQWHVSYQLSSTSTRRSLPSHLSTMGDIVARSVIEGHRSRLVNRLHSGLAISTAQTVAPYLCFMFILGCLDGLLH